MPKYVDERTVKIERDWEDIMLFYCERYGHDPAPCALGTYCRRCLFLIEEDIPGEEKCDSR